MNLQVQTSNEYKKLKFDIEGTLNRTYQDLPGFIKALVKKFTQGSVVVDFELIFDTKTAGKDTKEIQKRVEQTYERATADNNLGNYTVTKELTVTKIESQTSSGSKSSSKLATWIIVLIASCIVLVLLLSLLIMQIVSTFHVQSYFKSLLQSLSSIRDRR